MLRLLSIGPYRNGVKGVAVGDWSYAKKQLQTVFGEFHREIGWSDLGINSESTKTALGSPVFSGCVVEGEAAYITGLRTILCSNDSGLNLVSESYLRFEFLSLTEYVRFILSRLPK